MVHKKSSTNDIALRVATAMQQMGIDGLPRNYELVYEAYAGANPDLVREFIALGKYKTQAALDELGRKYLPHHHEESVLQRSAGAVRDEMTNFMELLTEEKNSLSDYGRIIGEASEAIGDDAAGGLGHSIEALKVATERQVSRNAAMQASVEASAEAVDGIRNELAEFEARKFTDPATGLGNRRAFNKAVAKVYANADAPIACGLVIADIEAAKRFSARQVEALGDYLMKHYGALVRQALPPDAVAARFDGLRFGFLLPTADECEALRFLVNLRFAFQASELRHPETRRNLGSLSFAAGLCMEEQAGNAFDLLSLGEKALQRAITEGGDRVSVHREAADAATGKDWMIYKAS